MINTEKLPTTPLTIAELEALRGFDTCTVANAIEKLGVRLRNEGYTSPGLLCVTGDPVRLVGYAVTSRVKTSNPPVSGDSYPDRSDWWALVASAPLPRLAVIQDIDERPGTASVTGEVHAAILQALRCGGLITNGAVRDVPGMTALDFPVYAHSIAVSHAYCHMVDFRVAVEIHGLRIEPGDLLLADVHGVLSVPKDIARDLLRVAREIARREKKIVELCRFPGFSIEALRAAIKRMDE